MYPAPSRQLQSLPMVNNLMRSLDQFNIIAIIELDIISIISIDTQTMAGLRQQSPCPAVPPPPERPMAMRRVQLILPVTQYISEFMHGRMMMARPGHDAGGSPASAGAGVVGNRWGSGCADTVRHIRAGARTHFG